MPTKSPAELPQPRDRLAVARSHKTCQDVRVRPAAVPRVHRGGDTDALDWHSDPHLLAILARGAKRERDARDNDQLPWRRDELDEPLGWLAIAPTDPHSHPQEVHSDADAVRSVP